MNYNSGFFRNPAGILFKLYKREKRSPSFIKRERGDYQR
jgi:hypothetical protein